jgi:hypothetical protein
MTTRYNRTDHVVERQVGPDLILVPMHTGPARLDALYTLNETAAFIWKAITPGITSETLLALLLTEYDAPEQSAKQDLDRILDRLLAMGAIQASTGD